MSLKEPSRSQTVGEQQEPQAGVGMLERGTEAPSQTAHA